VSVCVKGILWFAAGSIDLPLTISTLSWLLSPLS